MSDHYCPYCGDGLIYGNTYDNVKCFTCNIIFGIQDLGDGIMFRKVEVKEE